MIFFRPLLFATISALLFTLSVSIVFADFSPEAGVGEAPMPLQLTHREHARLEILYGVRRSLFGDPKTVDQVIEHGADVLGWVVSARGDRNLSFGNDARNSQASHWQVAPEWKFSGLQWTTNLEGKSRQFGVIGFTGEWEMEPHEGPEGHTYFSATAEVCNQTLNACWTEQLVDRVSADSKRGRFHMALAVSFTDGHDYIARLTNSSHVAWAMVSVQTPEEAQNTTPHASSSVSIHEAPELD